jgi:hypothetical protein
MTPTTQEQLILHLVFSETVKVHSLNLVAPELGQCSVCVYACVCVRGVCAGGSVYGCGWVC